MKEIYKFLDKKSIVRINLIFGISILTVLLETLSIVSIFPIMKTLFEPNFLNEQIKFIDLNFTHHETILYLLLLVILIFLIKNILLFIFSILTSKIINFAILDLTSKYFEKYLNLDYIEFIKFNSNYYIRNVIENINIFFGVYFKCVVTLFVELFLVIALLIILFKVDFSSTISFLSIFSVVGFVIYFFFKKQLLDFGSNMNEYYTKKLIDLNHGFTSFKDINLTNSNKFFIRSFISNLRKIALTAYKVDAINSVPRLILEVTGISIILIFIYINFINSPNSNDYFATLTLFALSGFRMLPSANRILSSVNRLKFSGPAIKILQDELIRFKNFENKENLNFNKDIKISFKKEISFKKLSFSYDNSNFLFKNLNLNFKKGDTNIIFGSSGCGKTTLINILLGFLKPTNGEILSDNQNVFLNLSSWRSNLAFVPQEINLADEKLISNIAFGINEAEIDKNKILKILDILNMKSFVENLPEKLDTRIGEKGFKISGGQRQRIALARCLYREKQIIILDEATSSLDRETEEEIFNNIKKNYENLTIIFVTHRNSMRKFADRIYRFASEGEIIEETKN